MQRSASDYAQATNDNERHLMAKKHRPPAEALTKERVREAIARMGGKAKKGDLARQLGISSDDKKELRRILRELEHDGALGRTGRRRYADATALPPTGVMEIVDRDHDGELIARMRGEDGLFGALVRAGARRRARTPGRSSDRRRRPRSRAHHQDR